ncbi:HDOD domain-containing protein [Marinomonas rhizomae]|uniref:HDOD domain-containing protein n=1 Tax=Marinomonas rhizomae TaxID=491948 RepID=A0A366JDH6_9GAMM|nr:HDOD domain-containing protein [Marinomonas rhizomae]RBP84354.1 HDOD domain-containing protein [Marinomonas rhizomae]RNF74670.1 HDOD domain-containing protein [Marinomonas rhizomae]
MKDKSPSGLNEWLHFLKNKKFPVRAVNLARLKTQIKRPDDTLDGMQANIASDPLLAFAILNEANRIVPNKNSEIKTPFHAAAMVGMNGIAKLFPHFISYETKDRQKQPHLMAFLRELQTSYEAATIARHWSIEKLTSREDDLFWITLFRDAARWLLWYYAYPAMQAINQKVQQGEKSSQAELNILGCRIDELTVHLCNHWNTPNKVIESFLTKHIPNTKELQALAHLAHHPDELPRFAEDKRLTILVNNPLIFSYCANKVAHEANLMRWDSKNLPFFYRVVATVMHRRIGEIIQTTHLASTEAAKLYNTGGKPPLALQLLDPDLYTKNAKANPKTALPPLAELKKILSQSKKYDVKQKAGLALKTIKQAIPNAQHSIIFKHASDKTSPIFQFGYNIDVIKSIRWSSPSSVFKKLCYKRSATHIYGQKLDNLLKDFPHTSDQIIDKDSHLILASTQISSQETLIFWLETRTEFNEKDYKNLKQIVSLISHSTL